MSAGPAIIVRREIHAPAEAVYEAWTRPELLAAWFGPADCAARVEVLEACVGGRLAVALVGLGCGAVVGVIIGFNLRADRLWNRLSGRGGESPGVGTQSM